MPYATAAELESYLGAHRYRDIADRDRDGEVDAAAVAQALTHASSVADSYLTRYLPIPEPVPSTVAGAVIALAVYELAGNLATTDDRQRYEDALGWLRDVAARRASLGLRERVVHPPGGEVTAEVPRSQMRHEQTRRIL